MEAMKLRFFVALMVVLMAISSVQKAAAAEAPAPSPTSDAAIFVPTFFASLVALAFGLSPEACEFRKEGVLTSKWSLTF
ncbi:hypothetical protein CMV_021456 [Castanea mollissima]|uniref:Uncharacterized protein n=1 Tax=Castanea mollissima TaxID=60419 RepID=A0A8J4QNZ0_9ROSI|nr:hypothetical protein CMV_021456 [Castanea mollissima]